MLKYGFALGLPYWAISDSLGSPFSAFFMGLGICQTLSTSSSLGTEPPFFTPVG